MPRQYHMDPLQGALPMEPPRRFELRTYALREGRFSVRTLKILSCARQYFEGF